MPEHLKNTPDSKEFDRYLKKFMRRKVSEHRTKTFRQAISSFATAISL